MFETMKSRTAGKKLGYFNYIIALTFLLMFLSQGCSKEENPAGGGTGGSGGGINALIGNWTATSVTNPNIEGGSNLISADNTMRFTFTATNYTFNNTGQFCDEGSETCTQTGTITATAASFTITWSDGSTQTSNYTLSGNNLTTTFEDGGTYTIICQKQ